MSLIKLSGTVSTLQHSTETEGTITGGRNRVQGRVSSKQVITFRVGDKPVQMKLESATSVTEGDKVTLIGVEKRGTFIARAMRNETTGAIDSLPAWKSYLLGGLFTVLSLPMLYILIGIPFLIIGIYTLYQGYLTTNAVGQLK